MNAYRPVTPWWARWLIRAGEWLIALGERGRFLQGTADDEHA